MADDDQPSAIASDSMATAEAGEAEQRAKLGELSDAASLQYSRKNYAAAADLYSSATELQAALDGDLEPGNAELLFRYGRCLYHVAVQNADVLGGKVAGEKKKKSKEGKGKKQRREANGSGKEAVNGGGGAAAGAAAAAAAAGVGDGAVDLADVAAVSVAREAAEEKAARDKGESETASNPFFALTGDESWSESEGEGEEEGEEEGEGEEDEDDFTTAYDILEVARVLLTKQIEATDSTAAGESEKGKGKAGAPAGAAAADLSPELRHLKERLADTRSLQAEICLEHERFDDAVTDARAALELCQELYGDESSLIAEAHYKLSLALEFASAMAPEGGDAADAEAAIDKAMREESAAEMESAIGSCKLRIEKEQQAADPLEEGDAKKKALKNIAEVKELLRELEERLIDLRAPPEKILGPLLEGILGPSGSSGATQKAAVEEATKNANDLSGLIKKKKKEPEKRKFLEDDGNESSGSKKARVEDA